jgi:hypothetical protein
MRNKGMPIYPKKFFSQKNIPTEDEKLIFVLMPFAEKYKEIYEDIIKPLVKEMGLRSLRADEIFGPGAIMEDILRLIAKARIIIADVTGRNPNVFYELGIAHTVKNDVIIITQNLDDVPFDLRHLRYIEYSQTLRGSQYLRSELKNTIESLLPVEGIAFDKKRRIISYKGKSAHLTPHEAHIIELFLSGSTVTHEEIVSQTKSKTRSKNPAEVTRPLISRLNSKIDAIWGEDIGIQSVRGTGYYLEIS